MTNSYYRMIKSKKLDFLKFNSSKFNANFHFSSIGKCTIQPDPIKPEPIQRSDLRAPKSTVVQWDIVCIAENFVLVHFFRILNSKDDNRFREDIKRVVHSISKGLLASCFGAYLTTAILSPCM